MEFLALLESIRTPWLDAVMRVITLLGDEAVFLALALFVFWCTDKKNGYYLLTVGFLGITLNQFLKITCRIPRPWVRDPSLTVVEGTMEAASGYSFPSGHTQNITGTLGVVATMQKRRLGQILCIAVILLVGFSRMYLGVHTPQDVLVSVAVALVLVFAMQPLFRDIDRNPQRGIWILGALVGFNLLFLLYATCWPFPADADQEQLAHGVSNAAKLTGALAGMAIGYGIEIKKIRFQPQAPVLGQILKLVLGLALVLAIKEGLKPILGSGIWSGVIRYGLITVFAAGIWPMTFPWFAKLGRKKA